MGFAAKLSRRFPPTFSQQDPVAIDPVEPVVMRMLPSCEAAIICH
jgi:hypothetical protein